MPEKIFETAFGTIHYWINDVILTRKTLVFLPGLTADHRLFDKQIEAFEKEYNLLTWDAPGHAASRPFQLNFSQMGEKRRPEGLLDQGCRAQFQYGQTRRSEPDHLGICHFP